MAIRQLKDNMSIISELSDEPNDIDGLSSTELKEKFDAAGTIIKEYVNSSLIPDVETEIMKTVSEATVTAANMPAFGTAGQALIKASDEHYDWDFKTMQEIPPGGKTGYVLAKTSDDDFAARFEPHISTAWTPEQQYEQAGEYTWTAPDAYGDGLPYSAGAYIIGGGGSGGAAAAYVAGTNDLGTTQATGGASGYAKCVQVEVTPGEEYPVVVGAGGAAMVFDAIPSSTTRREGNAGGSTAFAGISVSGGGGGWGAVTTHCAGNMQLYGAYAPSGGQGSDAMDLVYSNQTERTLRPVAPAKGQTTYDAVEDFGLIGGKSDPESTFNRLAGTWHLAAGGQAFAYGYSTNTFIRVQQGYEFEDGRSAGDGAAISAYTAVGAATGTSANSPGCGGGAAAVRGVASAGRATSGAGADGAVYIYIRRQQR